MEIRIETAEVFDCLQISALIPEFSEEQYGAVEYEKRLMNTPHIILMAYVDGIPAGFKVGYDRDSRDSVNKNGVFYSWMGGVLPRFRKSGVAKALAKEQEKIAKERGYKAIEFKTRNYLKPMLLFGVSNGFNIIGIEEKELPHENRIILRKEL